MAYLNKVMLIGNIGKDPVVSATPNGKKRVSFSLATSRRYRDNNCEQKEDTQWHNIVGWGKTAEIVEQLGVKKGSTLYVEGTLTNRSWTDQNGQQRYTTEVNLDSFQLLTPRNSNGLQSAQGNSYNQQTNELYNQQQAQNGATVYDDAASAEGEDGLPF